MTFSNFLLGLHNLNRYIIIVLAVLLIYRLVRGWLGAEGWADKARKLGLFYTIALDTQLLMGFAMYFVTSGITKAALSDMGATMSNAIWRFFALEHPFYMILSIVFAHIGSSAVKKEGMEDAAKIKRALIFIGLSLLMILLGHVGADMLSGRWIPWL